MRIKLMYFIFTSSLISAILMPIDSTVAEGKIPVSVSSLSTRGQHTCAIDVNGTAKCWGVKDEYQTDFPNDMGKLVQISQGWGISCAINEHGSIRCWDWHEDDDFSFQAPSNLGVVTQVAVGSTSACVIHNGGNLKCWTAGENLVAVENVPEDLGKVTQVVAWGDSYCALQVSSFVRCWGDHFPIAPLDLGPAKFLASGDLAVCAVTLDARLTCWRGDRYYDEYDMGLATNVSKVAVGRSEICAIVSNLPKCFRSSNNAGFIGGGAASDISVSEMHVCVVAAAVGGEKAKARCYVKKGFSNLPPVIDIGEVLLLSITLYSAPKISLISGGSGSIIANLGTWDSDTFFDYQWLRDGVPIKGSNPEHFPEFGGPLRYVVSPVDAGYSLSLAVTGKRIGYSNLSLSSNSVPIRRMTVTNSPCGLGVKRTLSADLDSSKSRPVISGSSAVGKTLKGSTGVWSKGTKLCVFWLLSDKTTPSLKSQSYKIQKADAGKEIRFVVVGTSNKISKVRVSKPMLVPVAKR